MEEDDLPPDVLPSTQDLMSEALEAKQTGNEGPVFMQLTNGEIGFTLTNKLFESEEGDEFEEEDDAAAAAAAAEEEAEVAEGGTEGEDERDVDEDESGEGAMDEGAEPDGGDEEEEVEALEVLEEDQTAMQDDPENLLGLGGTPVQLKLTFTVKNLGECE